MESRRWAPVATTREVAELLSVSPATVVCAAGAPASSPGYRIASNVLRFDERDVDEWLEARREGEPLPRVVGEP